MLLVSILTVFPPDLSHHNKYIKDKIDNSIYKEMTDKSITSVPQSSINLKCMPSIGNL